MVKVILGSAIGGLVAGGIALLASAQDRGGFATGPTAMPGSSVPMMTQPAGPTVACAPHQEPVVSRMIYNGQEVATLSCADRVPQGYVNYYPQAGYPQQPQMMAMAPAPVQVVQSVPRSAPAQSRPARQVVYRDANDEVVRYEPDVRPQRRSVAKTAMIIGGSAGTGAGVGAIVGGKKGALIGAAIGGGAASIFEATKR